MTRTISGQLESLTRITGYQYNLTQTNYSQSPSLLRL